MGWHNSEQTSNREGCMKGGTEEFCIAIKPDNYELRIGFQSNQPDADNLSCERDRDIERSSKKVKNFMRLTNKKMAAISSFASITFFGLAINFFAYAFQLSQGRLTQYGFNLLLLSIVALVIVVLGCFVSTYLSIALLKTKIRKETYFFALFALLFSGLSFVTLKIVLKRDVAMDLLGPSSWLVPFSIFLAAPISWILAGYSRRTILNKIRNMGLEQGMTILAIILLVSIPIVGIVMPQIRLTISNQGAIASSSQTGMLFQNGVDAAEVLGQTADGLFTAEVPVDLSSFLEAKQVLTMTSQYPNDLDLRIRLKGLNGNLSIVKEFQVLFTIGNGSEISLFGVGDGKVAYEEVSLVVEQGSTITMGITSSAQNAFSTNASVLSLLVEWNESQHSIDVFIHL